MLGSTRGEAGGGCIFPDGVIPVVIYVQDARALQLMAYIVHTLLVHANLSLPRIRGKTWGLVGDRLPRR